MGMCADGNCPECVASREKYAAEFAALSAEERRKGIRTFKDRVEVVIQKDRDRRRKEWLENIKENNK